LCSRNISKCIKRFYLLFTNNNVKGDEIFCTLKFACGKLVNKKKKHI
jgi:hypothetical protein